MNALKAAGVAVITLALASVNGSDFLYRIFYTLLVVFLVCLVWSTASIFRFRITREPTSLRAQVGQVLEERLSIANTGFWPKLWLEVRDHSNLPDYNPSRVVSLGPLASASWLAGVRCRRRGEYHLGPVAVSTGDPFGLFRWTRFVTPTFRLLVYPATIALPQFDLSRGDLSGGSSQSYGPHQPTARAASVRDYVPGDPLSHVHWPSTARARRFIVKEFELDPTSDVWLLLDLQAEAQRGRGEESTEEYGVAVAASLAKRLLEVDRAVGLAINDRAPVCVAIDRGPRQLVRVLECLAVVRADGSRRFAEFLLAESFRLSRNTTAIVITPSEDESWVEALKLATRRGAQAIVVFLEPRSFEGIEGGSDMASALVASGVPVYLVKQGASLAEALAMPIGAAAAPIVPLNGPAMKP